MPENKDNTSSNEFITKDELDRKLKERETSRWRATVTLAQDVVNYAKDGKEIPFESIKGFIYALLFPRLFIIIGSIIGAIVLILQLIVLDRQTDILSEQNKYFESENLILGFELYQTFLDNYDIVSDGYYNIKLTKYSSFPLRIDSVKHYAYPQPSKSLANQIITLSILNPELSNHFIDQLLNSQSSYLRHLGYIVADSLRSLELERMNFIGNTFSNTNFQNTSISWSRFVNTDFDEVEFQNMKLSLVWFTKNNNMWNDPFSFFINDWYLEKFLDIVYNSPNELDLLSFLDLNEFFWVSFKDSELLSTEFSHLEIGDLKIENSELENVTFNFSYLNGEFINNNYTYQKSRMFNQSGFYSVTGEEVSFRDNIFSNIDMYNFMLEDGEFSNNDFINVNFEHSQLEFTGSNNRFINCHFINTVFDSLAFSSIESLEGSVIYLNSYSQDNIEDVQFFFEFAKIMGAKIDSTTIEHDNYPQIPKVKFESSNNDGLLINFEYDKYFRF